MSDRNGKLLGECVSSSTDVKTNTHLFVALSHVSCCRSLMKPTFLLKWRRKRTHLVMWSDPCWASHIKVELVCFLFTSDVLLSKSLPLERHFPAVPILKISSTGTLGRPAEALAFIHMYLMFYPGGWEHLETTEKSKCVWITNTIKWGCCSLLVCSKYHYSYA